MINILIIDDNQVKQSNIKKIILDNNNIDSSFIKIASSIKDARKLIYNNYFDLAILDLVIPVESGGECASKYSINFLNEIGVNPSIIPPIHIVGLTSFKDKITEYHKSFKKNLWYLIEYEEDSDNWHGQLNSIIFHLLKVRNQYLESIRSDFLNKELEIKRVVEKENSTKKIFIGSSSEGLSIARAIQMELEHDANCEIWNQGIFEVGDAYIESLESALNDFDFGLFVFTPDDTIIIRGEEKKIARDNVIFELGMFIGKLTRKKAFILFPKKSKLHILSDMDGVSKLSYDPANKNLQSALGPSCEKIRRKINK